MTTPNQNLTNHYEVQLSNGDVFAEKCRNSFGGFVKMVRRVEDRYGHKLHFTSADAAEAATFTLGDLTGSFARVQKVGR